MRTRLDFLLRAGHRSLFGSLLATWALWGVLVVGCDEVGPASVQDAGVTDAATTSAAPIDFDASDCRALVHPGGCVPQTCASADVWCGLISDGCGGVLHCDRCPDGGVCGAVGLCHPPASHPPLGCLPLTCEHIEAECGLIADGCGSTIHCGKCEDGGVCGGGDVPYVCTPPSSSPNDAGVLDPHGGCVDVACCPTTCEREGAHCGRIADGCGDFLDCGICETGFACVPLHGATQSRCIPNDRVPPGC